MDFRQKLTAYVAPMGVFVVLLGIGSALPYAGHAFWCQRPEYWLFPAQTVVCGTLLWHFWNSYEFGLPKRIWIGLAVGLLVFFVWIAPQTFLGFAARRNGFDPEVFAGQPTLFWLTIGLRFLRLVVVVPFVEEIFWRGFLLRYLIDEKFDRVPIGKFSWPSFLVVTVAFALSHSVSDWPAAILTGALYNVVAYRTKSLATCVVAHALTNLLLGVWIMNTKQWGFW